MFFNYSKVSAVSLGPSCGSPVGNRWCKGITVKGLGRMTRKVNGTFFLTTKIHSKLEFSPNALKKWLISKSGNSKQNFQTKMKKKIMSRLTQLYFLKSCKEFLKFYWLKFKDNKQRGFHEFNSINRILLK